MRTLLRFALPAAAAVVATLVACASAGAQPSSSVWDGIYTQAQASQGAQEYGQQCAMCHGAGLNGNGEAPALQGGEFLDDFDGLTVGDLFDRLRKSMPSNAPGSLTPKAYSDVLAYILKANGFPAGQAPLSDRSAFLHAIAFQAENPHPGQSPPPSASATSRGVQPFGAAPSLKRVAATGYRSTQPGASQVPQNGSQTGSQNGSPNTERPRQRAARVQPADLAALTAANEASGVLSPTASDPRNAPNSQPDPYRTVAGFFKLPPGRTMGSASGVAGDSKGNIWVADRCGANNCQGSTLDPIMEFDAQGNFIKAFGAGMFNFPHGLYIDRHDHIWVTDQRAADGKGADVVKFDENGKVLMTLGKPGIQGDGPDAFSEPTAVVLAPNGDIFVADGHEAGPGHNARVVKFDSHGRFLMQWGGHGIAAGQFDVPHCLTMDREGRIYVGDRWNNRIQVFTQNGKLLSILTQFGRPSGIYVDKRDVLYVTDSESRAPYGYGYHPGWKRGVRVGSVKDGIVTAFIPDDTSDPDKYATSGGEGIWADASGAIYSAQVKQMAVVKYVRR